jgi:rRNA maturation endonuclease Nob1
MIATATRGYKMLTEAEKQMAKDCGLIKSGGRISGTEFQIALLIQTAAEKAVGKYVQARHGCKGFAKCVNSDGDWCANCGGALRTHASEDRS